MNEEVKKHIEGEILPRYQKTPGHKDDHIKYVIDRSLKIAEKINSGKFKTTMKDFGNLPIELKTGKVNIDMCYVIAAFHDLGREVDDEYHHLVSAGFLLTDAKLREFFSRDELRVMADAVMDHRASNQMDPITIYGRIVSSADRNTDVETILHRCYETKRAAYPDETEDEIIERARETLIKKYGGKNAYAAKKMFFPDPAYAGFLDEIERITKDKVKFRKLFPLKQ